LQNRQFGKTDLVVTPVCFGSWEIGGFPFYTDSDEKSSVDLIKSAYDLGVNFFDTAPVYGFGHAEELLGKAVKDFRQDVVISTKCDLRWKEKDLKSIYTDASSSSILEEIDLSLKRLRTDYIDMYMLHWPDKDTATPIGESIETLESLKKSGKIRFYGLSNFNVGQVKEASRYGDISFLQNEYSLINPGPEFNQLLYTKKRDLDFKHTRHLPVEY
jgi:aryl-alcohol dehydrogenase-like predicted oxidoreductase